MNGPGILIALVLGFIGGIVGALVAIEIKTDTIRKEIDDAVLGISNVNSQVKTLKDTDTALALAIQTLTQKVKTDRGAIWESLNGLWTDYDERHKADPEPQPEPIAEEKPKAKRTRKEPKTNEK